MFHGFHLVEEYHRWKKENRKEKNPIPVKAIKLLLAIVIPLFLWIAPSSLYGLPDINAVEHRVLAIFCFAALMWLFDAVPAWTTSLVVVVLLLFCTTNSSFWFFLVTALFSMFINNTATAAMMLTFLAPVLSALPADGKGRIGLALVIPIGANIGGMGTPIGTPPNAIALKFLNDPDGMNLGIGFGKWMMVMVPVTLVLLFIAWFVLKKLFPFKQKEIHLKIESEHQPSLKDKIVYLTFFITILLWLTDSVTDVNANVVAMLPVVVLCMAGIITKRDLEQLSWSILWMIAGAFALGVAMKESGLANHQI